MNMTRKNTARRNSMSKNAIDNENITKRVHDTPKLKGAHKPTKKARLRKWNPKPTGTER